jgi:hemerythrin-like domain-containing protein
LATKSSPLTKAFLDDHREMTRRIAGLLDALKRGDAPAAFQFADELDRVAGPHIEFEEAVFYPLLVEARGREFVGRLYREHGEGRHAVKTLLERKKAGQAIDPRDREELIREVETAMDHAGTCGTLLSHVATLDDERQAELLEELEKFRKQHHRWSELEEPSSGPTGPRFA